ncbi:MAG: nucleotidyltransferase domain-containing protein [Planctomycetes bacterium]|nr:nucleotidyltransferase domain-containing protein [Planctomycetota bacterium]
MTKTLKIPDHIHTILTELQAEAKKTYADRFGGLLLYGSYARGDFSIDSDIDVLILLEKMTGLVAERDKISAFICDLCLRFDVVISFIPFDTEDFLRKQTPLILNVKKEGIRL